MLFPGLFAVPPGTALTLKSCGDLSRIPQISCAMPLPCPAADVCVVPTRDGTGVAAILAIRATPPADSPSGAKGNVVLLDIPSYAAPEAFPAAAAMAGPEPFFPSPFGESPAVASAALFCGCGDALCALWDAQESATPPARKLRSGDPWLLQPPERPLLSIGRERLLATVHADGSIQLWCAPALDPLRRTVNQSWVEPKTHENAPGHFATGMQVAGASSAWPRASKGSAPCPPAAPSRPRRASTWTPLRRWSRP